MNLITKAIEERFKAIGSQADVKDPVIIAKFFNPTGAGTRYATEYDPEARLFYGYVSIFGDHNDEWGPFSLEELETVVGQLGLGIERDRFFTEQPISNLQPKAVL